MAERLKILLIENDKSSIKWFQSTLQKNSIELILTKSIQAIEKKAPQSSYDVIILGLSLLEQSRLDFIEKAKKVFPNTPVIVAISEKNDADALECVKGGAYGFITINALNSNSLEAVIYQAFERQKAIVETRESQRELSNLVSNLPGIVYRCRNDPHWTMEYISQGCKQLTGYSPDDLILNKKIPFNEVIHPDDRKLIRDQIKQAISKGVHYQLEYRIQTAGGEEKWVWEQGNMVANDPSGEILEGFITDVSDKKKSEIEMQLMIAIGSILRNSTRYEDFSCEILKKIEKSYNVKLAALVQKTNIAGRAKMGSAIGMWESFIGCEVDIKECMCYVALQKNKIVLYDHAVDKNRVCRAFRNQTSQYMAFVPMSSNTKTIGMIVVGRDTCFSQQELDIFKTISDMIAPAIERANLLRKTEKQLKRLESLHAIDQAITSIFDINVINKIILDQVVKELEADATDILILNTSSNMLECMGINGFIDQLIRNVKIPLTTSVAGKVLLENQRYSVSNLEEQPLSFIRKNMRVENFNAYFANPLRVKGEVIGVMEIFFRKPFYPDEDWLNFFDALSMQAAVAYDSFRKYSDLQRIQQNMTTSFRSTLETWSKSLELHDIESHDHIRRVTNETLILAKDLGVDEKDLTNIEHGAILHDIGKIAIMDDILQKKGTLTEKEWTAIKRHPQIAKDLLSNVKMLEKAMDIPYCHHENWDGTGYPQGLKGENIPLSARIFAVVETFDALTTPKPYRKAWSKQEAVKYLRAEKGKRFDPVIVDKFLSLLKSS